MSTTESDLTSADADDELDAGVRNDDDITAERDAISSDDVDHDEARGTGHDLDGDEGVDDQPDDAELVDGELDAVDETDRDEVEADEPLAAIVTLDVDLDDDVPDTEPLPEIVPATPDDSEERPGDDEDAEAFTEVDDEEVSEKILDELRQAAIDGPVVPFAPQDETTAARRRPRRAADYDPAPVPIPAKVPRVLGRKPRVRKVTRVVRHVDPWSVFKIALIAFIVLYVIVLTASVLLWNVATSTGTVDNVERFFESFGWNSFEFNGGELYRAGWVAGLFVVIGLTGLAVLTATLFNLITDLVGGVRVTVLEEEVVETRTSPMRRFVVRRAEPEVPAVLRDGSGLMTREAVVDDTGANDRPFR